MAIGAVAGASAGALSGSLTDYGINDDFVKRLGETIPVDSSALFILVKSVTEDKGALADRHIVCSLIFSRSRRLKIDHWMCCGRTGDIGARSQCCRADYRDN